MTLARNTSTGKLRSTRFLGQLERVHARLLPEQPTLREGAPVGPARDWRTTRIRPEVMIVIEGLRTRHKRNTGVDLTPSEVIAAVMIEGLPALVTATSGPFRL